MSNEPYSDPNNSPDWSLDGIALNKAALDYDKAHGGSQSTQAAQSYAGMPAAGAQLGMAKGGAIPVPTEEPYRDKWRAKNHQHATPYRSYAGGGAIPSFDSGGETPDFSQGGFGGGDTTPQPASGTPPAGQDTPQQGNNVFGEPVTQQPQQLAGQGAGGLPGAYQVDQTPGQNTIGPPGLQDRIQAIKAYLSGAGAMPKDQFELTNQKIDPQNTMDQNERSMRAFDVLQGQDATSYAQALRQHYDAYRGNAAKMIDEGNFQLAAQEASKGFQYVPDGTKTMVTPTKNGDFIVTTHTMDGQDQTQTLNGQQMKTFLTGAHGLFDHVVNSGVGGALGNIAQQAGKPSSSAEFGGPPTGGAPASSFPQYGPTEAQRASPDITPTPESPETGDPNSQSQKEFVDGHWVLRPGPTNDQNNPGAPQGVIPFQRAGADDELTGPITVVEGGHVTQQGNARPPAGTDPSIISLARQMHPGNPAKQAQYYEQQRSIKQAQENQVNVAKNTRLGAAQATGQSRENAAETISKGRNVGAETLANSRIEQALIRAQTLASNTDNRALAEQGRNATNVLTQLFKKNPQASQDEIDQTLQHYGINPQHVTGAVRPQGSGRTRGGGRRMQRGGGGGQAPAPAAPAPAAPAPAQPAGPPPPVPPPEALQMLKAHPETAAHFDAIFGPGASKRYLGQ